MKSLWTWAAFFSLLIVLAMHLPRSVSATPATAPNHGCSVASLKGTYAFRRTGVNNDLGGPIAQVGIDVFNGDGTRGMIRSTRSTNGAITDWTDFPPSGRYTIRHDCTGSFFNADGSKSNNVVVLDGGRRFILLSMSPDTVTTEEGQKLDSDQ